jgi:hypothetical protein
MFLRAIALELFLQAVLVGPRVSLQMNHSLARRTSSAQQPRR